MLEEKGSLELSGLPGKLADCQIGKQEGTELFIVEGDSQQEVLQNKVEIELIKQYYLYEEKF